MCTCKDHSKTAPYSADSCARTLPMPQHLKRRSFTADAVTMYLEQTHDVDRLSEDEERSLWASLHTLRSTRRSPAKDRAPIDAITTRLIESNLRLVIDIAKKMRRASGTDTPIEDLINEGNIGLMTAVERYDPSKGFRFSTYATWWIKASIHKLMTAERHHIRFPMNIHRLRSRYIEAVNELSHASGAPSVADIAVKLNVSEKTVRHLAVLSNKPLPITSDPDSHDAPHTDAIADDRYLDPHEAAFISLLKRSVALMLDSLNERQRQAVTLRFGLDGGPARSLEETGARMSLTRERVRQLLNEAFRVIRKIDGIEAMRMHITE